MTTHNEHDFLDAQLERLKAEAGALAANTAQATDNVLDACEQLKAAHPDDEAVAQALARIYESSGVQDIVNQRVGKMLRVIARIKDSSLPDVDPLLEGPQVEGAGLAQDDIDSILNGDSDEKHS